jgi:hypothetical protein
MFLVFILEIQAHETRSIIGLSFGNWILHYDARCHWGIISRILMERLFLLVLVVEKIFALRYCSGN